MKRHIQNAGTKKWFGDYFCELESEPLKAIDQWASAYEGCIISGGSLTLVSGTTYNVAAAMVVLKIDGEYKVAPMPVTNNVDVSVQKAIRLKKDAITGQYQNPVDLTIAYDYSAEIIDYTAGLGTLNQDYLLIPTNGNAIRMYIDVLKEALAVATTAAKGLMSASDKTKLDGIAVSANNYTHPTTHAPSIIQQDANNRFVTDAQIAGFWTGSSTLLSTTKKVQIGNETNLGFPLQIDKGIGMASMVIDRADNYANIIGAYNRSLMIDSNGVIMGLNYYSSDDVKICAGGGKVKIGSTGTPAQALDVVGNIIVDDVIIR